MRIFERPEMKISRFERSNILTASGETVQKTAVELAQADAAALNAAKTFTILAQ